MKETLEELNRQGFTVGIRNPHPFRWEVVIPIQPHGEFICQCGRDLDDLIWRAHRAAQTSKPPKSTGEEILDLL